MRGAKSRFAGVLVQLLFGLFLFLGFSQAAFADSFKLSDFATNPVPAGEPGSPDGCLIDGPFYESNDGRTMQPGDQLSIDRSCTVTNFSCDVPLESTLNFAGHPEGTLIIFDNVCYTGNFACANVEGTASIWAVNGSDFSSVKEGCQDLIIPVEKIDKQSPGATATVGVPFTYTLTIPVMYDPVTGTVFDGTGSDNELGNIHITDDLTAAATGAEMTLEDIQVYWRDTGASIPIINGPGADAKHVDFTLDPDSTTIPPRDQIIVELEVVLDSPSVAPGNVPGTEFVNTAEWEFSRSIDTDGDGVITHPEEFFDPLPGENGVSQPMTIVGPELVMTKTTPSTAIGMETVSYTLDVQNVGGWEAWNVTVEDVLPADTTDNSGVGMCEEDPVTWGSGLNAEIRAADGSLVRGLAQGTDYTVDWNSTFPSPSDCTLTLNMLDAGGPIGPNQHLVIHYDTRLDPSFDPASGASGDLTNLAGATSWFNGDSNETDRAEYSRTLVDGSGIHEDTATVTVALSGYYFEKTVENLTTGDYPAIGPAPGDDLRYTIRLFNVDQSITDIQITDDQLDTQHFSAGPTVSYCAIEGPDAGDPALVQPLCDVSAGVLTVTGDGGSLELPIGNDLIVQLDVTLDPGVMDGTVLSNQSFLQASGISSHAPDPEPAQYPSDDPFVNGVADPSVQGDEDPTVFTVAAPGPLSKVNPADTEVAIGETFDYTITVPAMPVASPLYDVHIYDELPANLTFISARADVAGNIMTLTDSDGGADNSLELTEAATGLDIPANEQAIVTLRAQVANSTLNQDGETFTNTAAYSYSRINGGTQGDSTGTEATTGPMTVVEPEPLAIAKTVSNVTAGKAVTDPAEGGDTLEYVISLTNGGTAVAHDVNVTDLLPPELVLTGTPTATIDGSPVTGFVPTPTELADGSLVWGRGNGDDSLDIPASGGELLLTYQVTVETVSGGDLTNSAGADWTSLDGSVQVERTGNDAPDSAGLNNYFIGPVSATIASEDTTGFAKSVESDSWDDGGSLSTGVDGLLRIGDTVTYALTLNLREGVTADVTVTDTLPDGLELASFSYVHDANISFTPVTEPTVPARGTLGWSLGDISNDPADDTSSDDLVIALDAVVVANDADTLAHLNSQVVNNSAELNYTGAAAPLPGQVDITVNQPVMSAITKVDTAGGRTGSGTSADPYQVDLATDVMQFQLQTCNDGDAPAYNVAISDTLATQFDEADLATAPTVTLGATTLTAGSDFTYVAPASRGGAFTLTLADTVPVDPSQCLVVDYNVGFHTDVNTTTQWSNSAAVDRYWSLPASSGQEYAGSAAQVWMVNSSLQPLPLKALNPVITEATIGDAVSYTITIPADNIVRDNVVVTDTLAAQLVFDSASLSIDGGAATTLTNTGTAGQVSLDLGTIQAGQEAVVTLNTHVVNTVDANAGDLVSNSASYTYTDGPLLTSDPAQDPEFTVVEPQVSLSKIANVSTVEAGDLVNYTVTLTEAGNADSSGAFDLLLTDTLDTGLAYEPGSTRINTVAAPDPAIAGQTLTWPERDLAIGETVTVEYQARVEDSVLAGQTLSNQAAATWTSLAGTPANEERDGSDGVGGAVNDYAAEAAVPVTVAEPLLELVKSHAGNSYDPALTEVRVGDTVDYRLRIDLPDGSYNNVVFTDQLPTGLAYQSMVSATVFGSVISPAPEPTTADGQALTWSLGTQVNPAEADSSDDYIELVYRATVLTDTLAQEPTSQALLNTATFSYDGDSQTFSDDDSETITLLQPLMDLSKTERQGRTSPYQVDDMVNDVMQFRLQSCNNGNAPSYSLKLEDDLPWELDETSLTNVVVAMDDGSAVAYSDNLPVARDGTVIFTLSTPVAPGQCVLVDYDIGFHTDVPANQTWENSVSVTEYWSLDGASGQLYQPVGPALFVMTNNVTDQPPVKTLTTATTATIGDTVTYTISVPEANAQRDNVVVTDNLPLELTFVDATVSIDGGAQSALTNTGTSSSPSLNIGSLASGQSAVVTLNTRVLNTADSNAGDIPGNIASYTYDALSPNEVVSAENTELTIVEPQVSLTKDARDGSGTAITEATAGDVINYTVTLAEAGNADSSDAFDLVLTDTLSAGLEYVPGSASIGDPATITIDADGNSQLTWAARDLAAGDTLAVTYQAQVQDSVVGGQALANNAVATWTSRTGDDAPNERNGSDGVGGVNDYVASDTVTLTVPVNVPLFAKQVVADTFTDTGTASDAIARPGDWIEYQLRVTLEKGTHTDLVLKDTLPVDLAFDSMVSASFFGVEQSPPPANEGTAQNLQWTLGDQTNPAGSASDDIVLTYRVLVASNLTQVDSTILTNDATLDYTVGGVAQPARESSADSTIWQPSLSVNKSVTTSEGDSVIVAGETVTYTVDITNTGTAPAYDTVLRDILPEGMRNNGGPTTTSVSLVNAGTTLTPFVTSYSAADGVATWAFDSGANNIAIPAQDTLRVVYTVTADNDLGADLTLENSALVTDYYSFDNEDIPSGDVANRQHYGPSSAAAATLTTPGAGALQKSITQPTAAVGEPFTYEISVPATPVDIALSDVHVLDDLSASDAALAFVSARYSLDGGANWADMSNVGATTALDLVDQATATGLDIPASGQALVEVSVVLQDDPANVAGLVFNNTATYRYSGFSGDSATLADTSEDMTIIAPDLVMTKSGPATMSVGTPERFTLDVQNVGTSTAWDITLTDHLPNLASGGMCDTPPVVDSVVVYESDGATPVATLVENTDFTTSFAAGSPCVFTLVGGTSAAALEPGQILRVIYQAELDDSTPANTELTNYAGATEWFSADDSATIRQTFSHTLQDVQEDNADPQDYHTLTSNPPVMTVEKTVGIQNDINGDGVANPGDTLRYTLTVNNTSPVLLPDFSLVDDLGALHSEVVFESGSLAMVSLPAGADDQSNANGGTNGAGLVDVRDLSLGAQGSANDTVTLVFDITLAGAIDNGTVVLNQGSLQAFGDELQKTDDPGTAETDDPTGIVIASAPVMRVKKISKDLTGDASVLMPGDTLRYTLRVKNIGDENAIDVVLRDAVPEFTRYVPGSTTLNGNAVPDPAAGGSPLVGGMLINAPGNTTAGAMDAAATNNVAVIHFRVTINDDTVPGTRIVNQGFVTGSGAGGNDFMEQPSDDPTTAVMNDPTEDIVGDLPLLDVQKTVALTGDANGNNAPDPDETLQYTFVVSNSADVPASGVVLTDQIPANTSYVSGSTTLDGSPVADVGSASALEGGLEIGSVAGNDSVVVTFDVTIDSGVADNTLISNQGLLTSNELPDEPSDADGVDSNGDQPTEIITGTSQQLSIAKSVIVVGGGAVMPGSELEYTVQVTNTGTAPATQVVLTDDLSVLSGKADYVAGSGRLNGGTAGVSYVDPVLTGNYGSAYGDLPVGESATLRFRVSVGDAVAAGTSISNTGEVSWNNATQTASDSVTAKVGAIPGTITLTGKVWHDSDFDNAIGNDENPLAGWTVEVYQNNTLLRSIDTDSNGDYVFTGLPATQSGESYELRFRAPGATAATALLGLADSDFVNHLQRISDITATPDSLVGNLNLPIDPNGVVYNAVTRQPVAGATVTLVDAGGAPVADSCLDGPAQQGQVTPQEGFYKFDINFSGPSCGSGGDYRIVVEPPAGDGYESGVSRIIAPITDEDTAPYDVPSCTDDARADSSVCEAQTSAFPPPQSVDAGNPLTGYYLNLSFADAAMPDDSQIFNNHLPLDPVLDDAVTIRKVASVVNVSRGQFVPYVIEISNGFGVTLPDLAIIDSFPAGFKYVSGSARLNDQPVEPTVDGLQLIWDDLELAVDGKATLKMLFVVGSGVSEGEYINRAQVMHVGATPRALPSNYRPVSGEASAAVRVVPDPDFDCTDVIGKVFDDSNMNGYQDDGEAGLPNVRAVTAQGLIVTSDEYGRFHITCAVVPNEVRGSNFILKVDDRTLPTGYRLTTENPLVRRATRGKMVKFNFGAALHRVVRLDLADAVFEPGTSDMRLQWQSRMPLLMEKLEEAPSLLRLAYMAETESPALVKKRLKEMKKMIADKWVESGRSYELVIETEVFWRTGAPLKGGSE